MKKTTMRYIYSSSKVEEEILPWSNPNTTSKLITLSMAMYILRENTGIQENEKDENSN